MPTFEELFAWPWGLIGWPIAVLICLFCIYCFGFVMQQIGAFPPPENTLKNSWLNVLTINCRLWDACPQIDKWSNRPSGTGHKRRGEMEISICKYNRCSGGSKHWSITTKKSAPYRDWNYYARINAFGMCVFLGVGSGISLGDPGYYKSYSSCPSMWCRVTRWLAFRTHSLPRHSRPYPEHPKQSWKRLWQWIKNIHHGSAFVSLFSETITGARDFLFPNTRAQPITSISR